MSEYIDREELMDAHEQAIWVYENANILNARAIRDNLKPLLDKIVDVPSADVVEAKHGRWIPVHHNGDLTGGKCSVCGKFKKTYNIGTLYNGYKTCHNCGAKMDGGN